MSDEATVVASWGQRGCPQSLLALNSCHWPTELAFSVLGLELMTRAQNVVSGNLQLRSCLTHIPAQNLPDLSHQCPLLYRCSQRQLPTLEVPSCAWQNPQGYHQRGARGHHANGVGHVPVSQWNRGPYIGRWVTSKQCPPDLLHQPHDATKSSNARSLGFSSRRQKDGRLGTIFLETW